ncbi:MAG TPA: DUF4286 family protein [Eudoraea sp.]|nr:DUF4286 family protein [Eudoraea sp.]
MYIYNVTINIDESVHEQWLLWMKESHIPDVLATGKFTSAKMCKVLAEEETGGITYAIQYATPDKETLERYYKEDADRLRQDFMDHFAGKFVAFRTELQIVDQQESDIIRATEYLFTYGTLTEERVQMSLFSRKLKGAKDHLAGFRILEEKVAGLYPTISFTGNEEHLVPGEVFAISGTDLMRADVYEGDAYHRKKVALLSGTEAWVYLGKSAIFKVP